MGDLSWIGDLVGNYAFPIAACIYLALENREQRKVHSEESDKLRDVLERNTLAISHLADKIGGDNYVYEDK